MNISVTDFTEPDIDNQLTSISFLSTPETKKITSNLPLALKGLNNNQINKHNNKKEEISYE